MFEKYNVPQCDYMTDIRTFNAQILKTFALKKKKKQKKTESVVNPSVVYDYTLIAAGYRLSSSFRLQIEQ